MDVVAEKAWRKQPKSAHFASRASALQELKVHRCLPVVPSLQRPVQVPFLRHRQTEVTRTEAENKRFKVRAVTFFFPIHMFREFCDDLVYLPTFANFSGCLSAFALTRQERANSRNSTNSQKKTGKLVLVENIFNI